jgi:hypothetical protein
MRQHTVGLSRSVHEGYVDVWDSEGNKHFMEVVELLCEIKIADEETGPEDSGFVINMGDDEPAYFLRRHWEEFKKEVNKL